MHITPLLPKQNRAAFVVFTCLSLLILIASIHGQTQSEVAPPAKSDTSAVTADGKKLRVQNREVAGTNFRISGVDLASGEEVLLQATKLFGKSPSVSSGDASTSYRRVCYRSATENDNTYLTFGQGEVDSTFVLSSDSSVWKGNHICNRSRKITRNVATDSGLHLGLTQAQVIAILGLATRHSQNIRQHRDALIYSLEVRKKADVLVVNIDTQFVDDSLTRLAISWSSQN